MASTKVIQRGFGGGEQSPQMFGRIDDPKYQTGLEVCRNFICLPQGPIQNRPGFEYVLETKYPNKKCRIIPFVFNLTQTFIIELGDKYARFHTRGGTLMNGETPYEIQTPWEEKDLFDLHYTQSNDVVTVVHPSYAPREIRRYSNTDWRLVQCSFGTSLKTPTNVKAERVSEAADDSNKDKYTFQYKVSCLNADKSEESAASASVQVTANLYAYGTTVKISCDAVEGATFYRFYKNQGGLYSYIGDSETTSIIDDNIGPNTSITPRRHDSIFKAENAITAVTVTNGGEGYKVNGAPKLKNFKSGGIYYSNEKTEANLYSIRLQDNDALPTAEATVTAKFSVKYEALYAGGNRYVVYLDEIEITGGEGYSNPELRLYYDGKFVCVASGKYVNSEDVGTKIAMFVLKGASLRLEKSIKNPVSYELTTTDGAPSLSVSDPTGTGALLEPVIEGGVFKSVRVTNGGQDYSNPTFIIGNNRTEGSGATFKATIGSGGNYPAAVGYFEQRRVFGGFGNDPQRIVMTASSTESDLSYSLPTQDTDRINFRIAAREFNRIEHVVPLAQLMLLTTGAEMRVSPLNSDAITPSSISVRPQSYIGTDTVQPVIVNNNVIYASARDGHLRELAYQYSAGGYVAGDLCLRSAHLFDFRRVKDMALFKAPVPIIWAVSSDGRLLGLTYIPEQQIGSWHQHDTDGYFESCACISEDEEDRLYVVTRRVINGETVRFIERMSSMQMESLQDAFFVDCGATYEGEPAKTISGLTWLEGKTVSILADGAVMPQQKVIDGKIQLDVSASKVVVGLPYGADAKTLPVIINDSAYGLGRNKNVSRVTLKVYQSSGIFVGSSFDEQDLVEYKQRTTEPCGDPPEMVSGDITIRPLPSWTDTGSICIRQADPLPLTLLSYALDLSV